MPPRSPSRRRSRVRIPHTLPILGMNKTSGNIPGVFLLGIANCGTVFVYAP